MENSSVCVVIFEAFWLNKNFLMLLHLTERKKCGSWKVDRTRPVGEKKTRRNMHEKLQKDSK